MMTNRGWFRFVVPLLFVDGDRVETERVVERDHISAPLGTALAGRVETQRVVDRDHISAPRALLWRGAEELRLITLICQSLTVGYQARLLCLCVCCFSLVFLRPPRYSRFFSRWPRPMRALLVFWPMKTLLVFPDGDEGRFDVSWPCATMPQYCVSWPITVDCLCGLSSTNHNSTLPDGGI